MKTLLLLAALGLVGAPAATRAQALPATPAATLIPPASDTVAAIHRLFAAKRTRGYIITGTLVAGALTGGLASEGGGGSGSGGSGFGGGGLSFNRRDYTLLLGGRSVCGG